MPDMRPSAVPVTLTVACGRVLNILFFSSARRDEELDRVLLLAFVAASARSAALPWRSLTPLAQRMLTPSTCSVMRACPGYLACLV